MLDALLTRHFGRSDKFTDAYRAEQSIARRKLVNPMGDNLSVLFPPWHGGGVFYERLIHRLARRGDAVLAYYFDEEILKPDAKVVVESFEFLRDAITSDLEFARETYEYKRIGFVAMSLGNPVMSITTGKFRDFDSATLVVSASSLARSMWYGIRTQHIRAGIERQGHDLASLDELWKELAPMNHLDALADKEVTMLISTRDTIIPTRDQMLLLESARTKGIEPIVHQTRLGHYATVGRFCLYGDVR